MKKQRGISLGRKFIGLIIFFSLFLNLNSLWPRPNDWLREELTWRAQREKEMLSPESWLTIVGLFWLHPGKNSIGGSNSDDIKLPDPHLPAKLGDFILTENKVTFINAPPFLIKLNGRPIQRKTLVDDTSGKPDILSLKNFRFWIIRRGQLIGLRLRDLNSPALKNFKGLDYFPPQKTYIVQGKYLPFSSPRKIIVPNRIGTTTEMMSLGKVKFHLQNQSLELIAFQAYPEAKSLFIIFADQTNGEETYAGGRFLFAQRLSSEEVILNFNRAINPPCAYTPYATCPLSPRENYLPLRVEAGEKRYPGSAH
ncbi:MAG: DUF1684 domain-containing protein [Candidatus Aminicenantes bacterium]|nr:DUF1684 domain-containing protein [Candidatus Aminicenantes bacterium]